MYPEEPRSAMTIAEHVATPAGAVTFVPFENVTVRAAEEMLATT